MSYSEHTISFQNYVPKIKEKENIVLTIGWQGTIGNVMRKGIDKSIKYFAKLYEIGLWRNYKFLIVGRSGEGSEYLRKLIQDLGMEENILLLGEVDEQDKIELLDRSKYYMQLSSYEGFGISALEALRMKNIVIHSGKGGLGNNIFKSMIKVNIDNEIDKEIPELIRNIKTFDFEKVNNLSDHLLFYYDDNRRLEDFKKIIK